MRDRLIKLVDNMPWRIEQAGNGCRISNANEIADYLLANGVIVPPCKVGDTVYRISKRYGKWEILPRTVSSMTYALDHFYRIVWCIHTTADDYLGKTVFLTREEAETAIAERNKK